MYRRLITAAAACIALSAFAAAASHAQPAVASEPDAGITGTGLFQRTLQAQDGQLRAAGHAHCVAVLVNAARQGAPSGSSAAVEVPARAAEPTAAQQKLLDAASQHLSMAWRAVDATAKEDRDQISQVIKALRDEYNARQDPFARDLASEGLGVCTQFLGQAQMPGKDVPR